MSSASNCGGSPTRRSSISAAESQLTSASGVPTGGERRSRSRHHDRSGCVAKTPPLGVRLPDFGFGSAEGPKSPPGPVEKTLKSWGKNISEFGKAMLPGTGGKENAGGVGMIQAPAPMQPLPEKTPSRRHGHGEHHHHSRSSRHGKEEQYGSLPHGVPPYNEAQQTPALDLPKFAGGFGKQASSRGSESRNGRREARRHQMPVEVE